MSEENLPGTNPTRRGFLERAIAAIAVLIGAFLAVPLAGYTVLPAFRKRQQDWIDIADPSQLKIHVPEKVEVALSIRDGWRKTTVMKSVWVVRQSEGNLSVYSPLCTHLGCAYRWERDREAFFCPCHASVFDIRGEVLSGPAPRPLDTLPTRTERDRLSIIYKEFKPGTSKKVEI